MTRFQRMPKFSGRMRGHEKRFKGPSGDILPRNIRRSRFDIRDVPSESLRSFCNGVLGLSCDIAGASEEVELAGVQMRDTERQLSPKSIVNPPHVLLLLEHKHGDLGPPAEQ